TGVVFVPSEQLDLGLSNLAVIDRRDILPLTAAPMDIASNRQVALSSARPIPFDNGGAWWWKTYVRSDSFNHGAIQSNFGYYIALDPTKYTLVTLTSGSGSARFYGAPVSL